MGFFGKFFGKKKKEEKNTPDFEQMSPMEEFVYRFTQNGGRFLLAQSRKELEEYLQNILTEEGLDQYYCPQEKIRLTARKAGLKCQKELTEPASKTGSLSEVLHIIQGTGGIMISGLQTGGENPEDLPRVTVFIAHAHQLRPDMHEAMSSVNSDFQGKYPSQIRTLAHFARSKDENPEKKICYLILHEENRTD